MLDEARQMERLLDQHVRIRANHRCEYCRLAQAASKLKFPIDHIIALQHHGLTESMNLALCCGHCNRYKGPNLSGIDPETGLLTRLFHPRNDKWVEHFRYDGPILTGISAEGRTTAAVLRINHPYHITVRRVLIDSGVGTFHD